MAIPEHLGGVILPMEPGHPGINVYADEVGTWHAEVPDKISRSDFQTEHWGLERISLRDAERIAHRAILRELIQRERKTGESLAGAHSRINRTMGSMELIMHAGGMYEFIER